MAEIAQLILEWGAEQGAVGGIQRAITKAVVRIFKGNDVRSAGGEAGGLEGGFDGFEARVGEEDFAVDGGGVLGPLIEGASAEFAGETCFEFVGVDVAHGVKERCHLPLAGADHGGIGMAGGGHGEGAVGDEKRASPGMGLEPKGFPRNRAGRPV